ncbi:M48 family metallopeptidase [Lysinibacillus sp. LZ02]|uniref:M48 family metallopeptidase n=1 Tax=Lysinibacillus sp. LZ02 TaxID=3420668 RepID=UPI003D35B36E
MKAKWGLRVILLFGVYAAAMYFYIFYSSNNSIPDVLKGTAADPSTYMTGRELYLSENYSKIRNFLYFIKTPFEWLIYLFVLITGLSELLEKWSLKSKWTIVRNALYVLLLSVVTFLLLLPINYCAYFFAKSYGVSTQPFQQWLTQYAMNFGLEFITSLIFVSILYFFIRRAKKRWWVYVWAVQIPITLFYAFIQPQIIDPLYNDFTAIEDKQLEEKILALAEQANIPADHVYEVEMADETTAMNAYVNGIGSNARIVLWDTTLQQLSEEEVLFVMAHEMAHYVHKDIYKNLLYYFGITFILYWLIAKWMPGIIAKYGAILNIKRMESLHSLPLYLILSSMLFFATNPLDNAVSRHHEIQSDNYALALIEDESAAISSFQALARAGLSEVNPPLLVKWFRYTHPPLVDRIYNLMEQ